MSLLKNAVIQSATLTESMVIISDAHLNPDYLVPLTLFHVFKYFLNIQSKIIH